LFGRLSSFLSSFMVDRTAGKSTAGGEAVGRAWKECRNKHLRGARSALGRAGMAQ